MIFTKTNHVSLSHCYTTGEKKTVLLLILGFFTMKNHISNPLLAPTQKFMDGCGDWPII